MADRWEDRPPLSLQELLRWSIKYSDSESFQGVDKANLEKIDHKWIDAAFPNLTKVLTQCILAAQDQGASLEDRELALDELLFHLDSIDNSADLHKCGGTSALLELLGDAEPTIRAGAAWCLSTAVAHNPIAQRELIARGGLEQLMERLTNETDPDGRAKLVGAMSALIGTNAEAQEKFERSGGFALFADLLRGGDGLSIKKRVAFFMFSLMANDAARWTPVLLAVDVPATAVALLPAARDDLDTVEKVLSLLTAFLEDGVCAVTWPALNAAGVVAAVRSTLADLEAPGRDDYVDDAVASAKAFLVRCQAFPL